MTQMSLQSTPDCQSHTAHLILAAVCEATGLKSSVSTTLLITIEFIMIVLIIEAKRKFVYGGDSYLHVGFSSCHKVTRNVRVTV